MARKTETRSASSSVRTLLPAFLVCVGFLTLCFLVFALVPQIGSVSLVELKDGMTVSGTDTRISIINDELALKHEESNSEPTEIRIGTPKKVGGFQFEGNDYLVFENGYTDFGGYYYDVFKVTKDGEVESVIDAIAMTACFPPKVVGDELIFSSSHKCDFFGATLFADLFGQRWINEIEL